MGSNYDDSFDLKSLFNRKIIVDPTPIPRPESARKADTLDRLRQHSKVQRQGTTRTKDEWKGWKSGGYQFGKTLDNIDKQ